MCERDRERERKRERKREKEREKELENASEGGRQIEREREREKRERGGKRQTSAYRATTVSPSFAEYSLFYRALFAKVTYSFATSSPPRGECVNKYQKNDLRTRICIHRFDYVYMYVEVTEIL